MPSVTVLACFARFARSVAQLLAQPDAGFGDHRIVNGGKPVRLEVALRPSLLRA
jgi:hypothetical protein